MKKIALLLLGFIIIGQGCQTNSKLSDLDKESIVKAVKEKSEQFWSNTQPYDTGSFRKFAAFWDENSDKAWQTESVAVVFNTGLTKSSSEWLNNWKDMIDNRISTVATILESHFNVLGKDKVLEVNSGDYTVTGKDSTIYGPFKMVNTIIWANINGDWKMQFFHESWVKKQ
jgi:hypothetical protein